MTVAFLLIIGPAGLVLFLTGYWMGYRTARALWKRNLQEMMFREQRAREELVRSWQMFTGKELN